MKHYLAKELNEIAQMLPVVYEEKPDVVSMSGYWLNRSAFGEVRKFPDDQFFDVPIPKFIAVEHKQQIKDAYKNGGMAGVKKYVDQVKSKL